MNSGHHGPVRRLLARIPKRYLRRLPARLAVPLLSSRAWPRAQMDDVRPIAVPEPFRLEVYWLTVLGQQGPALSLFLEGDEILRVDCLPEGPHCHYGLAESHHRGPSEARVYFPPGDLTAQIDRAVFELGHNVPYCTGLHRRRSWRNASIDRDAFARAADDAGVAMRDLLALHG